MHDSITKYALAAGRRIARLGAPRNPVPWQTTLWHFALSLWSDGEAGRAAPMPEAAFHDFVTGWTRRMPAGARDELIALIEILEAATLPRFGKGFSACCIDQQIAVHRVWSQSHVPKLIGAWRALRQLCMLARWSSPAQWPRIDYTMDAPEPSEAP